MRCVDEIGKGALQDRERQDVATEAYRDVFTAVLKSPLPDLINASYGTSQCSALIA
jgi:hypothetical protein